MLSKNTPQQIRNDLLNAVKVFALAIAGTIIFILLLEVWRSSVYEISLISISGVATKSESKLLSIKDAARYLGICERTLYSYTTQYGGMIPLVKLSKRCNKIDIADLDAFIDSRKRGIE